MNQLHPGARWIFRANAYYPMIFIGFFLTAFSSILFYAISSSGTATVWANIVLYVLIVIGFGELYTRLSYNRWRYEVTPEAIKIEHGIIWKKSTSIPYQRIQNIDIYRGIIAQVCKFSTVYIETASQPGWGGNYGSIFRNRYGKRMSEGYLPAVSIADAEKIADFVMKKIKHIGSGAGL